GFRAVCKRYPLLDRSLATSPGTMLRIAVTFLTVALGWIFFRATSFGSAATIFQRMFVAHEGQKLPHEKDLLLCLALLVLVCHTLAATGAWRKLAQRLPSPALGFVYGALL